MRSPSLPAYHLLLETLPLACCSGPPLTTVLRDWECKASSMCTLYGCSAFCPHCPIWPSQLELGLAVLNQEAESLESFIQWILLWVSLMYQGQCQVQPHPQPTIEKMVNRTQGAFRTQKRNVNDKGRLLGWFWRMTMYESVKKREWEENVSTKSPGDGRQCVRFRELQVALLEGQARDRSRKWAMENLLCGLWSGVF